MNREELGRAYDTIRGEAIHLAGAPAGIPQRAALLHEIFLESNGNHTFPQVALHGALWAHGYFEAGGRVARLIQFRYVCSGRERRKRMAMLRRFAEGFQRVNRSVFVDTYTNYAFTKRFGREPEAAALVPPALLDALNGLHAATTAGRSLSVGERRRLFERALLWEQEVTVAPGVAEEKQRFGCPILSALCMRPLVRFAYFPRMTALFFRDFSDREERIEKAMRSYDLAQRAGWDRVTRSMRDYRVLPAAFLGAPRDYVRELRLRLLAHTTRGTVA